MPGTAAGTEERLRSHALHRDVPSPRLLDGALLGNGGMGVVVTTRPDAVVLTLGHHDVWDRRIDESHAEHISTFADVLAHVEASEATAPFLEDDAWFSGYRRRMAEPYSRPYPRPLACGSLVLGVDRRTTEVLGHTLDLADGCCRVQLSHHGQPVTVEIFCDQGADDMHLRVLGGPHDGCPFDRIRLLPDPEGPAPEVDTTSTVPTSTFILPRPGQPPLRDGVREIEVPGGIGFTELLPSLGAGLTTPLGAIEVSAVSSLDLAPTERADWYGGRSGTVLERAVTGQGDLQVTLRLRHGYLPDPLPATPAEGLAVADWEEVARASRHSWQEYWSASSVALSDPYLEGVWYRSTYFARCALRAGSTAPGLFGSWIHRGVGAAWHGDYHMNYNAQQTYWGCFSSNRVEQHLPYVDLLDALTPVSRRWAEDYYRMRGAAYPHSAYNVPMVVNPYPNPVWAWEVSESPWSVQSVWWHYLYTQDTAFLRDRAMPLLHDVVLFLLDYLLREDNGPERWGDDRVHVFPTVAPEVYGLSPGLRLNRDCLLDIALIRFVLGAWCRAADLLEQEHGPLREQAEDVLARLCDYPTAPTPEGPVFVSVPGEDPDVVYNVPIPGMTVFPGEQHSWESDPQTLELCRRSVRRQLVEGGNDLVFAHLQAVRLDVLDLDRFRRQLRYCELGNGTFTDMVLQVHGRYHDATPFEFMESKGVWVENFGLTAVINEMLLQSYSGTLRLFPGCAGLDSASFSDLRAVGAFLVSASTSGGRVDEVTVLSEAGADLRLLLPWDDGAMCETEEGSTVHPAGVLEVPTRPGQTLRLRPRGSGSRGPG